MKRGLGRRMGGERASFPDIGCEQADRDLQMGIFYPNLQKAKGVLILNALM